MEVQTTELAFEALRKDLTDLRVKTKHLSLQWFLSSSYSHSLLEVKGEADLFEHSEEHFSAEITKRWSLVRMYGEAVRSDLNILVPERLRVENYLHHHPLLDVRHRVHRLKLHIWLLL